jgi:hypothetical protein
VLRSAFRKMIFRVGSISSLSFCFLILQLVKNEEREGRRSLVLFGVLGWVLEV